MDQAANTTTSAGQRAGGRRPESASTRCYLVFRTSMIGGLLTTSTCPRRWCPLFGEGPSTVPGVRPALERQCHRVTEPVDLHDPTRSGCRPPRNETESDEQLEKDRTDARRRRPAPMPRWPPRKAAGPLESVPPLQKTVDESPPCSMRLHRAPDVDRLRIELSSLQDQLTVFQRQEQLARNFRCSSWVFPTAHRWS
jgi:hypothetical protein